MKHELNNVIAVVNNKGGVGKTTTVHALASIMLKRNKNLHILMIDLDSQCNLSRLCRFDKGNNIYDCISNDTGIPVYKSIDGLYYAPASFNLRNADVILNSKTSPNSVLSECFEREVDNHTEEEIENISTFFDYVFIDCPPALSRIAYNAMMVADVIVLPVQMEGFSVNGVGTTLLEMKKIMKVNPLLAEYFIVPVMVDMRRKATRKYMNFDFVTEEFRDHVTKTFIRPCSKVNEAQEAQLSLYDYAPACTSAEDYTNLCIEIFGRKFK